MPWTEPAGDDTWRVRYRRTDGTKGAISGFPNATAAEDHISTMLHEQRAGTWIDPEDGRTTVAEFAPTWLGSLDIDQRTEENYRSFLKVHILPRWGNTAFAELTNLAIRTWENLRAAGLAKTTVDSIIKCLSLLLSDAVPERLIAANPLVARRRGRHRPTSASSTVHNFPRRMTASRPRSSRAYTVRARPGCADVTGSTACATWQSTASCRSVRGRDGVTDLTMARHLRWSVDVHPNELHCALSEAPLANLPPASLIMAE